MPNGSRSLMIAATLFSTVLLAGCTAETGGEVARLPECAPDNDGLTLPEGFCALVVADDIGRARHLAVRSNGDLFVALRASRRDPNAPVGVLALRDTTGDGLADVTVQFGDESGSGIALRDGFLYFAPDWGVLRYPLPAGALEPAGPPDTIVRGLPDSLNHASKTMAFGPDGSLYVNIGAPSNACQQQTRSAGSPGMEPCPQLQQRGGIWKFDANTIGQTQSDGMRYATGIRNAMGLTYHDGSLYSTQHGRDGLFQLWPDLYTAEESAELPSEELIRVQQGDDFGWPYCYYDHRQGKRVLAPEYGGDGQQVGRCDPKKDPLVAFPGHWGPNGLLFYTGEQFPAEYRGGAFIAFHGSWNRAPLPQEGYHVVFVPFQDGQPAGEWRVFAEGFARGQKDPRDAPHRPTGLAQGPDGSLYVSDDSGGRIWRIQYRGTGM